jgi:hypothetical protein
MEQLTFGFAWMITGYSISQPHAQNKWTGAYGSTGTDLNPLCLCCRVTGGKSGANTTGGQKSCEPAAYLMGPINGSTFNWILWFSSWQFLTACWHGLRDSLPTSFGDTSSQTASSLSPKYGSCYGKLIPRNLGTLRFDWSWFLLLGWQPMYTKCQPTYNMRH